MGFHAPVQPAIATLARLGLVAAAGHIEAIAHAPPGNVYDRLAEQLLRHGWAALAPGRGALALRSGACACASTDSLRLGRRGPGIGRRDLGTRLKQRGVGLGAGLALGLLALCALGGRPRDVSRSGPHVLRGAGLAPPSAASALQQRLQDDRELRLREHLQSETVVCEQTACWLAQALGADRGADGALVPLSA